MLLFMDHESLMFIIKTNFDHVVFQFAQHEYVPPSKLVIQQNSADPISTPILWLNKKTWQILKLPKFIKNKTNRMLRKHY